LKVLLLGLVLDLDEHGCMLAGRHFPEHAGDGRQRRLVAEET